MPRLPIILLAALVFAIVLLVRLPAAWVLPVLHRELTCAASAGSIWDGECRGAKVRGVALDELRWHIHPLRLLHGRLAARLSATRGAATASGEVSVGWNGALRARALRARVPLQSALLPIVPSYLSGRLEAHVAYLEIARDGAIERLQGEITVRHLIDSSGAYTPLGSFAARFPARRAEPVGELRDLGGPLWLRGTLRLTGEPGYRLRARVSARPDAAPSLVQALQYLGAADAEGRRPFALAGTY